MRTPGLLCLPVQTRWSLSGYDLVSEQQHAMTGGEWLDLCQK
jgi:hypothetical protein